MRPRSGIAATLLVGLVPCLVSCGGTPDPTADAGADGGVFPPAECTVAGALQTVTSASGAYSISACASPTPARGINDFTFFIAGAATGAAVDGLTIAVQTWMPDMGHGGPTTPAVSAVGGGLYDVTNCVFTMGGLWQLRATISGSSEDGATDDAIVQFTID